MILRNEEMICALSWPTKKRDNSSGPGRSGARLMIIKRGEKIAGVPALKIRDALYGVEAFDRSYFSRACKLTKG
jgi:hypothetical protein